MTTLQTEVKTTTQTVTQEPESETEVLQPIYAGQTQLEGINKEEIHNLEIQNQGLSQEVGQTINISQTQDLGISSDKE